jgi:ribosomal protein S18 acetylase RimI-like enzyme
VNYRIERVSEADVPRLCKLLGQLFAIEADFQVDEARQRQALGMLIMDTQRSVVFCARDRRDFVVGMVSAQLLISTAAGAWGAVLEDLIVDPAHRRRGVGQMLVDQVREWAVEKGAQRLQLLADKDNFPALDFYSRRGFRRSKMVGLYGEV